MSGAVRLTARQAGLIACRRCGRVHPGGAVRCQRCHGPIRSRDTESLQKVWAWLIAGIIAFIPANIYPMLITSTLLTRSEQTIIGGAIELMH